VPYARRMVRFQVFFATASLGLAAACAGTADAPPVDAPVDGPAADAAPFVDHTFVAARVEVPVTASEARMFGFDIDGAPADGIDNAVGEALASLATIMPGLWVRGPRRTGVGRGAAILLLALRGPALTDGPLTLSTYQGATPTPAPCASATDTVCGRHLQGTGHFTRGEAQGAVPIPGRLTAGTYIGGEGEVVVPVIFGDVAWLPLRRARAELTGVAATGFTGKLGGAITTTDLAQRLYPGVIATIRARFDADCDVGGTPPNCGCTPADAPGATLRGLFDKAPADCVISDTEATDLLDGFFAPDIDTDGDGTLDAVSFGVGVTGVAAQVAP